MVAYWAIDRQGLQDATAAADDDENSGEINTNATLGNGHATDTAGDDKGLGGQTTGRLANLATQDGGEEEEAPRQGKMFLDIVARYATCTREGGREGGRWLLIDMGEYVLRATKEDWVGDIPVFAC